MNSSPGRNDLSPLQGPGKVILNPWVQALLASGALYLLIALFFRGLVLGDHSFAASGDSITALTFERWGREIMNRGIFPLWNPFVFSGMPSFGSLQFAPGVYPVLWLRPLYKALLLGSTASNVLFHHFLGGLFMYLLLRDLKLDFSLSLFGAVIFFFSPQEIILGPVAHGGKLFTIAYLPLVFLLTRRFLRRPDLLSTGLLTIVIAVQLLALHMQIAYYGLMMIGLYFLADAVQHRKERKAGEHLVRLGGLAAAGVLALAISAYLLWPVYEYSHFSIRGGGAVGGGVSYGYATNWSFHPLEALTLLVPSWFGFGGSTTYWGYMPFTDHPYYMGLVPLMLAVVALVLRRRERLVQVVVLIGALSLLVSFGKWFPLLYRPLFHILPFFAKFRIPAMILILLLLATAVLAALGLQALLRLEGEARDRWSKRLLYTTIALGVILLIVLAGKAAFGPGYVAAAAAKIGRSAARQAYDLFWADLLRVMGVAALAALVLHLALRDRLPAGAGVAVVCLLVAADLWVVNARLVETVGRAQPVQLIASNPHTEFLKAQEGTFRIFNPAGGGGLPVPRNYWMAHGLEDVEGYSPAKLRSYQQLRESPGDGRPPALGTPTVLAMLNARYVLYGGSLSEDMFTRLFTHGDVHIYQYAGALGPAWLVGEAVRARGDQEVLNGLVQGFDASRLVLTTEQIGPLDAEAAAAGHVTLLQRDIHNLRYRVEAEGPVLLVLSEVYYPAGWSATVDGVEVPIHRVNHVLRAVKVDPVSSGGGSHMVELSFRPHSVYSSRKVSWGALLVAVCMMGAGGWLRRRAAISPSGKEAAAAS